MVELPLPYPPSANRYWRNIAGRTLISREGRAYADLVTKLVNYQLDPDAGLFTARLAVEVDVYPPDHRRRDLDNVLKASLDAMTKAGVWEDDSQIDRLVVTRCAKQRGGSLLVRIAPFVYNPVK